MKRLIIFGGPNGSGKSTMLSHFYSVGNNKTIPCINPDNIAKTRFGGIEDYHTRNMFASEYAQKLRFKYMEEDKSFLYETVFSRDTHLQFMKQAKEKGYFVSVYYVATENADINVARVAKRVQEGGHDVDTEKIRSRFDKCLALVPQIMETADFFVLFDNSQKYSLVILKHQGKFYLVNQTNIPLPEGINDFEYITTTLSGIKELAPSELEGLEEFLQSKNEN